MQRKCNMKGRAPQTHSLSSSYVCAGRYLPLRSSIHFSWQVPALVSLLTCQGDTSASHQWEVVFCQGPYLIPKAPFSLLLLILWLSPGCGDCLWAVSEQTELLTCWHLAKLFFHLLTDWPFIQLECTSQGLELSLLCPQWLTHSVHSVCVEYWVTLDSLPWVLPRQPSPVCLS